MGLTTSKEELNPRGHPAIWISEPTYCSDFRIPDFSVDDKPPAVHDDALWNDFATEMSASVRQINQHLVALYVIYTVILTVCLVIGIGGRILWVQIITFPIIFAAQGGHYWIVQKSRASDVAIREILGNFQSRFVSHEIELKYVTKWTKFCKPPHQRAMRVLLFKPVRKNTTV